MVKFNVDFCLKPIGGWNLADNCTNVTILKKYLGKNYLLRMCNDLLRRLSQAQNNVFCGRIQLFLARLFPLSEKSALNLVKSISIYIFFLRTVYSY